MTRTKEPMPTMLREALVIVSTGWLLVSAYSAIPYMLAGTFEAYIDAYFESISGFTTTGATVLTSIETQPHGILLWRSLTQWLGGMGIIMFFVAILPQLGVGATYLVSAEAGPGPEASHLTERIRHSVRVMLWLYVGISVIQCVLLLIVGLPFYDSLIVTFSTMPTGGFSVNTLSIAGYNSPAVEGIVTFFMAAAGVNFGLYYILIWKRSLSSILRNRELHLYIIIMLVASTVITLDLIFNTGYSIISAIRHSIFQTVSVQTTTGFSTADFGIWTPLSQTILLTLMLIGGCAGSTGGGLKVIRVLVIERYINRQLTNAHSPRAIMPLKLGGKPLSERWVMRTLGFVTLYAAILVIFSLLISTTGLDMVTSLSAVIANLSNVGPGLGMVGPAADYTVVAPFGKIILILSMLLGRLEFYPVLAITTTSFWKWR